ncbi:MAG TPA: response regulator [Acidimicrobiales bacterium]|jgi:DNA-binding NarL/FixJ family response regulator|nr:response regulator [Acidimicrobiales bacterium]
MPAEALRALSCNDDAGIRRAVEVIVRRCGYDLVGDVGAAGEAIVAAGVAEPDVVVLDLALTGDLGLGAVAGLHAVCPRCAVIVVSSFDSMRQAALAAGAYDFVGNADLRALERALRRLAGTQSRRGGASGQVDRAPTPAGSDAVSGTVSTKAPAS